MKNTVYDIIRIPVITEKSTLMSEGFNKYSFEVAKDATKVQIKKAVESIFGVKVLSVNTMNVAGKLKRFRGKLGKRADRKKAIVTVEAGKKIDLSAGV